jgi:hypothetical protein
MEALRQSLERVSANKKKAAKAISERPVKEAAPRKRARG